MLLAMVAMEMILVVLGALILPTIQERSLPNHQQLQHQQHVQVPSFQLLPGSTCYCTPVSTSPFRQWKISMNTSGYHSALPSLLAAPFLPHSTSTKCLIRKRLPHSTTSQPVDSASGFSSASRCAVRCTSCCVNAYLLCCSTCVLIPSAGARRTCRCGGVRGSTTWASCSVFTSMASSPLKYSSPI